MKAVLITGKNQAQVGEFPEPEMSANSVKIDIAYCGLCGSDIHEYHGVTGSRPFKPPVVMGHEISGIVSEVGAEVRLFQPGDRVTADPNWHCGMCRMCRQGLVHLCEYAYTSVRGMCDHVVVPQECVYHIPDTLSLRDAALVEPVACCLRGMDKLNVLLGETVAVVGMGPIGMIMVQLCRQASAGKVIVIANRDEKREPAFELGATHFINSSTTDPVAAIKEIGVENVDKVMECVGRSASVETALDIAGFGARVALFGLGDPADPVTFDNYAAIIKELDIQTAFLNSLNMNRAIDLLACGALDTELLVSKEMDRYELVEELAERKWSKKGKVLVDWKK